MPVAWLSTPTAIASVPVARSHVTRRHTAAPTVAFMHTNCWSVFTFTHTDPTPYPSPESSLTVGSTVAVRFDFVSA